ncbi:MAG: hypothetical protein ACYDAD_01095 [Acidimicrobiales bacterium]
MYAASLRLRAEGVERDRLARAVGVDPEALPALLALADAKLEALRARREVTD